LQAGKRFRRNRGTLCEQSAECCAALLVATSTSIAALFAQPSVPMAQASFGPVVAARSWESSSLAESAAWAINQKPASERPSIASRAA
jgi:hypothetical protein